MTHDPDARAPSSPRRSVGVVVNPERSEAGDSFVDAVRDLGATVEALRPGQAHMMREAVRELLGSDIDVVAAIGGDGTQRAAAAELVASDRDDVALAVVPGGTVNLLARVLGVADIETAARAAAGEGRRTIDVGSVDGTVFVLNASTGWDASMIDAVDDRHKRFGRLGYAAAGVRRWMAASGRNAVVRVDGEEWYDGPAHTVLVLNVGQRGSPSIHLAPDAEIDDGALDVVVLRRASPMSLVRTGWSAIRRHQPEPRDGATCQGREIEIVWSEDVAIQRDGDACGQGARTTYRVLPSALTVCAAPPGHGE